VELETSGLTGGNLDAEITQAIVGRRNDSSFLKIQGRIESTGGYLGSLKLLIRGSDSQGNTLFSMPWTVRDSSSPLLIPGDSEVLSVFRWLAVSETEIDKLELTVFEMESPDTVPIWNPADPELVWEAGRPEGASLEAEIRDFEVIEAYDRQVILMDLSVKNNGVGTLNNLSLGISLGSDLPDHRHVAVNREEPGMAGGERRVWSVAMGVPLDTDLSERVVTVRVTDQ
jgi:hypothetical protein